MQTHTPTCSGACGHPCDHTLTDMLQHTNMGAHTGVIRCVHVPVGQMCTDAYVQGTPVWDGTQGLVWACTLASGPHTDVLSTRRYIRGTCKYMRDTCRDVFRPMHRPKQCHPRPVCSCHYPQCPAAYTLVRFNQQMSTEHLVYGAGGLCSALGIQWGLKKQAGLTIYKSQGMEAT